MKKIVITLFVALVPLFVSAQVGELSLRAKGKLLAPASFQTYYINGDTASLLVEQNASTVNARYELVRMDMNQKEQARAKYRRAKDVMYVDGFDNEGGVDLLVKEQDDEHLKVFHEHRDSRTLETVGEPRLLRSISVGKKDMLGFIYRTSPDKRLGAGIYVQQREGEGAEAEVVLYSRKYEEYWTMSTRLRALDFARVTDSGEVIVGGWGQKKDGNEVIFEVTLLDGEKDHTSTFRTNVGRLTDVQFANYANGKVYLFALVRKDGDKHNGSQVDRLLSLCYNTATGSLTEEVHELTKEEINRLCNQDDRQPKFSSAVQFLQIEDAVGALDGHYEVILTQRWLEVDQHGLPNGYFSRGLMLITVDSDGHMQRFNTRRLNTGVPMNQYSMNRPSLFRTEGGSLLFYTEHAESAERDLAEHTKRYQPVLLKGVMTVVFTPDEGTPKVQHFDIGKTGLYGLPKKLDDKTFLLFFRNLSKAQAGVFKVKF